MISLPDNSSFVFYHPSIEAFDGSNGISESSTGYVLVDMGDGRMLPGSLEVTVVEG